MDHLAAWSRRTHASASSRHLSKLSRPNCGYGVHRPSFCGDRIRRLPPSLRTVRIAASNAANPKTVTFICRDPLGNIPIESREGARKALANALNVRNRSSKRRRFGFSTSEDAVTWVLFTYLLHSGQLLVALRRARLISAETFTVVPTLLLWGAPIGIGDRGAEIQTQLRDLCVGLKEDPNSCSEPDVIVDLGEAGLIFIEVKYLSRNDRKPQNYSGWSRYE
jgi:hypothetical protein